MLEAYNPRTKAFPDVVKNLMIINGLFFLATFFFKQRFDIDLVQILGLHNFTSEYFRPWQLVTHLFMHGGFEHILFNMFALWMFGSMLENVWGPKRFLIYYMFTGLGAALLHSAVQGIDIMNLQNAVDAFAANPDPDNFGLFISNHVPDMYAPQFRELRDLWSTNPMNDVHRMEAISLSNQLVTLKENIPTVGASGAVFGILLGFGMLFPNTELMLIFFPIPIKAKYFVALYGIAELYFGIRNNPYDNVAHFAHLGGMLFGFILIKYWNKTNRKSLY